MLPRPAAHSALQQGGETSVEPVEVENLGSERERRTQTSGQPKEVLRPPLNQLSALLAPARQTGELETVEEGRGSPSRRLVPSQRAANRSVQHPEAITVSTEGGLRTRSGWDPQEGGLRTRSGWDPQEGGLRTRSGWDPQEGGLRTRSGRDPQEGGLRTRSGRDPQEGGLRTSLRAEDFGGDTGPSTAPIGLSSAVLNPSDHTITGLVAASCFHSCIANQKRVLTTTYTPYLHTIIRGAGNRTTRLLGTTEMSRASETFMPPNTLGTELGGGSPVYWSSPMSPPLVSARLCLATRCNLTAPPGEERNPTDPRRGNVFDIHRSEPQVLVTDYLQTFVVTSLVSSGPPGVSTTDEDTRRYQEPSGHLAIVTNVLWADGHLAIRPENASPQSVNPGRRVASYTARTADPVTALPPRKPSNDTQRGTGRDRLALMIHGSGSCSVLKASPQSVMVHGSGSCSVLKASPESVMIHGSGSCSVLKASPQSVMIHGSGSCSLRQASPQSVMIHGSGSCSVLKASPQSVMIHGSGPGLSGRPHLRAFD
ncbi:unnamed protein product [Boreogadus saida]